GAVGDAGDGLRVALKLLPLGLGQIVDLSEVVGAASGKGLGIGAEDDLVGAAGVRLHGQPGFQIAVLPAPDVGLAVAADRPEQTAVAAKGDTVNDLRCVGQVERFLTGGDVPEANDLVGAAGGQHLAVGVEGDARHLVDV